MKLINTRELEYLIELVLMSGRLKNAQPLSLLISADKVGAGKTTLLEVYRDILTAYYVSDITAWGIQNEKLEDPRFKGMTMLEAAERGLLKHILIGDLLTPLVKQKKTRESLLASLNQLIYEGVKSVHHYGSHFWAEAPVRCGIITTVTKSDIMRQSRRWTEIGFLSRCIPVTYKYSEETVDKIYHSQATDKGSLMPVKTKNFWMPRRDYLIEPDLVLNTKLIPLAKKLENQMDVYGFRYHKQLETLMMANAMKNQRLKVRREDYERIMELSIYLNYDFTEI